MIPREAVKSVQKAADGITEATPVTVLGVSWDW